MKIIPAIDLIDGQNVRLTKGNYETKNQMKRSPEDTIKFYSRFNQVARVHVVDLMGALEQESKESELIGQLKNLTGLPLEIGGGLRTTEAVQKYADLGLDYFILGTRAILDLPWLKELTNLYPSRIFVGIDARGEYIYVNGWTENSQWKINDYVKEIEDLDLAGIIYTDIEKDGMEEGPNFERTAELQASTSHKVVASGGVRSKKDLDRLEKAGISEAIVGKAAHKDEFWEGLN